MSRYAWRVVVALVPLVIAAVAQEATPVKAAVKAAVTAAWLAVGALAVAAWLHRHRRSPVGTRWPAPFTWAAGAAVVQGNPWIVAAAAVCGWVLTGRDPAPVDATSGPTPDAPRLTLRGGQRAMWYRTAYTPYVFATTALLAVAAAAALATPGLGVVGVLGVAAAIGAALQSRVAVRVGDQGVTVTQPLLRRTVLALPLRHIEQAYVEYSSPLADYGLVADGPVFGWRSRSTGPVLRLRLADRRDCVLTVDDATTAAALVNTCLDRLRTPEDDPC
ncbi:hypothetical protein GCM10022243_34920 [Saccharothrix violaceirubra]|uniref:Uncharacterized protein n=1 Tax=Saccharothrix violaceirubra TaxID=413306 RepID=A0A7W7WWM6_9PSEU|nr:hypothetical protein [Saccharothrix violaceirubra]MBB4966544.1 hypothetical protein [Saccharothrix violaceirubra]